MRVAIVFLLVPVFAMAQVRPQLMEEASRENLPSQKLGVDDLIAVSVYDAPELTRTVRVEPDGAIHLPMLTEGVPAAGLFAHDVEASLVAALKTEQILVDPVVKVTVAEYHSRPISVMGAVRKPLTFQAVGTVTLLDALARAEGLSPDAGTEVLVSRPQPSPDSRGEVTATLVERIPLKRLLKDADSAVNYPLHGGEEIRVPEAGKIFVLGNVKKPGAFPVHDAGDNSILKMVALSEGVLPYAAKLAYIYRRDANGDKREIPVEFDKIMQRKSPDVLLQADDVLYIPDNKTRRNAVNVIDRITSFGASTASGVLIGINSEHFMRKLETHLPALAETFHVAQPLTLDAEFEAQAAHVPLTHYLWILRRQAWKIAAFVIFALLATLIVSLRLTPIYESTVSVDIDRQVPTGVLGDEATRSSTNDADQFIATQVKLIESDSVLRPVVDKFRLRQVEKDALEEAVDQSPTSLEAPVILKRLKITRPPNTYILQISYRSANRQLAADVANDIASSYLAHTYRIRYNATASLSDFMERQLEELKAKMEKSSAAVAQFERELNVINPEAKTSILSARLLELNSEYTKTQADRVQKEAAYNSVESGTLEAAQVSTQGEALKKLTENLNEAREKFAEVKNHYGMNHPEFKKAETRVQELESQLASTQTSVRQRVDVEYRQAVDRETMLSGAVQETKSEFDRLNARSFEYQTLQREADGDKKLYEELVRKIKEAGINASFQNSSIRVADLARPGLKPVFPRVWLNLLLAFLFSAFLAVGIALVGDVLDNTVRDPDQVTRLMKAEVIGSLPAVKDWRRRLSPITAHNGTHANGVHTNGASNNGAHVNGTNTNGVYLNGPHLNGNGAGSKELAVVTSENGYQALSTYEEAIRTLRNSILLTDFDRRLRSILLTSASPSEGKSTVAAHLAATHAGQGKRTLLIDGDLRRPSVHRLYQVPNSVGLSNVLLQQISWRDALVRMPEPAGLDILPAGPSTRRASDLIGTGLAELLEEAAREYDLVVLDAPPLLGFAEPLQMASAVDGVIVVARAGDTSRTALASVITTLARLRANLVGVVLNEVHREISPRYYYSYYNRYSKYYAERNELKS